MIDSTKIIVRYAETDKMGIVHHSVYPVWYEVARTNLIKKAGLSYSDIEKAGIMLPLISLNCQYISSCTYEDEVVVTAKIKNSTAVRLEFEYEVYKNERLINRGSTTHAWVDSVTFKPINIKKKSPLISDAIAKLKD